MENNRRPPVPTVADVLQAAWRAGPPESVDTSASSNELWSLRATKRRIESSSQHYRQQRAHSEELINYLNLKLGRLYSAEEILSRQQTSHIEQRQAERCTTDAELWEKYYKSLRRCTRGLIGIRRLIEQELLYRQKAEGHLQRMDRYIELSDLEVAELDKQIEAMGSYGDD
jgi:hypothetical protein